MNDKSYQWTLYLIVFVIISTISIQVYWNYKNYTINKQQLVNDVQVSLDNAVDAYYANLAERNTTFAAINMALPNALIKRGYVLDNLLDSLSDHVHTSRDKSGSLDRFEIDLTGGVHVYNDSILDANMRMFLKTPDSLDSNSEFRQLRIKQSDTNTIANFRTLTSKVIISMTQDSLNLHKIDSMLIQELSRKNINVDYSLAFDHPPAISQFINKENYDLENGAFLTTASKSSFLPNGSLLKIQFSNETKVILKRILLGILLSTLLVLSIISCLIYLLGIIKHQKQLAEVKNDFISNITHEFKTPIATIGVALESIKDFNVIDDKEKTKSYLKMSNDQLSKLNVMVEKLLETAALDSESLSLNIENANVSEMLQTIVNKHQMQIEGKTLQFVSPNKNVIAKIDVFHFENAINNVIDNAIKYGGDTISIHLRETSISIELLISDNGNSITKTNKERIFEKFYRIPKGNTHDIKGFGIGLYYAKKIIEKHNGLIQLDLSNDLTTFKILLPNE